MLRSLYPRIGVVLCVRCSSFTTITGCNEILVIRSTWNDENERALHSMFCLHVNVKEEKKWICKMRLERRGTCGAGKHIPLAAAAPFTEAF